MRSAPAQQRTRPFGVPPHSGNSPKGIHDLAQGQRAIASATLGTAPPSPCFSPKGIHTQEYRPTIGWDRFGSDDGPTRRRTMRTALNLLLSHAPPRPRTTRTAPKGLMWFRLPVIARSEPLWEYRDTGTLPSVAPIPSLGAQGGATRQSHISQPPLSAKS